MKVYEKVEQYLTDKRMDDSAAAGVVVSTVNADRNKSCFFKESWSQLINVGTASMLLRGDICRQLIEMKKDIGFRYIRIWNLFTEEMLIKIDGNNRIQYNFSMIDRVLDFLMENNLFPYIELHYKPRGFFKNIRNHVNLEDDRKKATYSVLMTNIDFIEAFAEHVVNRYGSREVENWYIEMELPQKTPGGEKHNLNIGHEEYGEIEYFTLFEIVYRTFKNLVPGIKIGGAGFRINVVDQKFYHMVESWKKREIQPDMLTIYSYPYIFDEEQLAMGQNPYTSNRNHLKTQLEIVREALERYDFQKVEVHVTEWNMTLSQRNMLNDGDFKGAYIIKNLIDIIGIADLIGYWMAFDGEVEYVDSKQLLYGGCGLLSKDGLPKPAYHAFQFMNIQEHLFLGKNENAVVTYNGQKHILVTCHNYKHFNFRFYQMDENILGVEQLPRLFEDNEYLNLHLHIENMKSGKYRIKTYNVNREAGNIQTKWREIGDYPELHYDELKFFKGMIQPNIHIEYIQVEEEVLDMDVRLAPHEFRNISITQC